jgi:uncharacterized protein YlxW (UPF0749 family)
MSEEHKQTGTGWPQQPERAASGAGERRVPRPIRADRAAGAGGPTAEAADDGAADRIGGGVAPGPEETPATGAARPAGGRAAEEDARVHGTAADILGWRPGRGRLGSAGVMIAVLLVLLGFTLAVQLRSTSTDADLATVRQDDLVRILSDLEAQEQRLRQEIAGLEDSQRQLASGAQGRQAALDEATRRADELGILAGTLPARGPGLRLQFISGAKPIKASGVLDAVQELRGAGAEAMQIAGGDGRAVRIIASTYFLDEEDGINVAGRRLTGPYTLTVIGDPTTMRTALNIPGGVVASVGGGGGNLTVQERELVDVDALSVPTDLKFVRPVS